MNLPRQLPLNVRLDDEARLDNFWTAPDSSASLAIQALRDLLADAAPADFVYLWGAEGAGCSHLLQAASAAAQAAGHSAVYLPLDQLASEDPTAMLDGLEQVALVCLDGLDGVVGRPDWDVALFHFFNRWRDYGQALQAAGLPAGKLLVAAHCPPRELPSSLPDLVSRMGWGLTLHLPLLDDEGKKRALQLRAQGRGMLLTDEVANYVLGHVPRSLSGLMACLDQLDRVSLTERRRLTIPLVRQVMGW